VYVGAAQLAPGQLIDPYVRPTTPGSNAVFGVALLNCANVTPKMGSTMSLSVCALPGSLQVDTLYAHPGVAVAAGAAAFATSSAVTVGFVVPAACVMVVLVGVAHVSVGVLVLQAMGVGNPLLVGNVYPPTAPSPPEAV
jgi:hypothetical protein